MEVCTYKVNALRMQERWQEKTSKFGDQPLLIPADIDPEPVGEKLTARGRAALREHRQKDVETGQGQAHEQY